MKKLTLTLDELITIADKAYPDGFVKLYYDNQAHPNDDVLAKFIAIELKETYDPSLTAQEQIDEARRVIEAAIAELQGVVAALDNYVAVK